MTEGHHQCCTKFTHNVYSSPDRINSCPGKGKSQRRGSHSRSPKPWGLGSTFQFREQLAWPSNGQKFEARRTQTDETWAEQRGTSSQGYTREHSLGKPQDMAPRVYHRDLESHGEFCPRQTGTVTEQLSHHLGIALQGES